MRVVVALPAALGAVALALVGAPSVWRIALLAAALGFVLAGGCAATDIPDGVPSVLALDVLALMAYVAALTQVTSGNRTLVAASFALALAAQLAPLALRRSGRGAPA